MQCHLVYGSDMASDLKNLLEADDLSVVLSSKHRPHCILEFISHGIRSLNIEETRLHLLVIFLDTKTRGNSGYNIFCTLQIFEKMKRFSPSDDHFVGVKDFVFPRRNQCLWTAHGHSHPAIIHSTNLEIFGALASYTSHYTLGWLPLDCGSCNLHQCCFSFLHWRGLFHSPPLFPPLLHMQLTQQETNAHLKSHQTRQVWASW